MRKYFFKNLLFNPGKLFLVAWLLSIFLYLLQIGEEIVPSNYFSILFLILCVLLISIPGFSHVTINFKNKANIIENKRNIYTVAIVFLSLLFFEIANEIIYFRTLPFLASFSLDDFGYNDATSVFKYKHNFFVKANSIFLSGYFFFLYQFFKQKKIFLVGYLIVVTTSLLYLSRSTMISMGIISLIIYVYFNKLKWRQVFLFIVLLVVFSYVFDKVYFLRNRYDYNFYVNKYEEYGFWTSVGRGFEGIYAYIATPVSNLLYNIDYGTFDLVNFRPSYILRGFIPSKIAIFLFGEIDFDDTVLFPGTANTFTTLPPLFFSFGLIGTVFILIPIGSLFKFIYQKSVKNPIKWFLVLVFLNHIVVLSIFSTSLVNLVYIVPLIVSYVFSPIKYNKTI